MASNDPVAELDRMLADITKPPRPLDTIRSELATTLLRAAEHELSVRLLQKQANSLYALAEDLHRELNNHPAAKAAPVPA